MAWQASALAAALAAAAAAAAVLLRRAWRAEARCETLEDAAERRRAALEAHDVVEYRVIGRVQSCWRERFGTPRQAALVPHSRARLAIDDRLNPRAALDRIGECSHVWILYHFHLNTNAAKAERGAVPAKVRPPRGMGARVGVFATRAPHRPNPIGLSVARLEGVDDDGRTLLLSGVDLVDGTPVLDVKPYIHIADRIDDAPLPSWVVGSGHRELRSVTFRDEALETLRRLQPHLLFYSDGEAGLAALRAAVTEVLRLDIRALHSKRSYGDGLFGFCIDLLNVSFRVDDARGSVEVLDAELWRDGVAAGKAAMGPSEQARRWAERRERREASPSSSSSAPP